MPAQIKPYKNSALSKKHQVAAMFNNIAWRYDFLNHFLSFGIDHFWRRKAVSLLRQAQPKMMLDIATGTADLAIEAMRLKPEKIFGIDISPDMIRIGKTKIRKKNLDENIELIVADSENLFFDDNKFDAITVGFGVRNFEDLQKGLAEMYRVLKPGGNIIILEFSKPDTAFIRFIYRFYATRICPLVGKVISKDNAAYSYLYKSIEAFPEGESFLTILSAIGFNNVKRKQLTFGIVSVYSGKK